MIIYSAWHDMTWELTSVELLAASPVDEENSIFYSFS